MHRLRTYIAGMGSGGAILGAIAVAFVVLGAVLSTEGLPIGSAESSDAAVEVDSNAPEAAAAAAALASLAPAADPAPAPGAAPGTAAAGAPGTGPGTLTDPGTGETLDPGALPDGGPGTDPPAPGAPTVPPVPAPEGDVGGLVGEVDETVQGTTGLDLGLGEITKPATDALDETIKGVNGGKPLGLGSVELPLGG